MNGTETIAAQDFLAQARLNERTAPSVRGTPSDPKTKEALQDFEAFFISQMFEQMYSTVPVNETFGGGNAEMIFRSMLVDEYGKMMAKSGGIGLTDQIMGQLIQQQEAAGMPAAAVPTDNGGSK